MRLNYELTLAAGVLVAAACGGGDDKTPGAQDTNASSASGNQDAGSVSSSSPSGSPSGSSGGSCGKGEFKFDDFKVEFCGAGADDGHCKPIASLAGYKSFNGDIELYPGSDKDLSSASCLEQLGALTISDGTELTNLQGLGNLKRVLGLDVLGMKKLTTLSGIDKLLTADELTVNGNYALTDIKGLPDGLTVGELYIAGNQELVSLDGLANLTVTKLIGIENNPKLSSCKVAAFAKRFPNASFSNFGNLTEQCN